MNDRAQREAVRMLKKLHNRVEDLEESDRGGEAPRLLRSISDFSADDDVVSIKDAVPPSVNEASADTETVDMTSTPMSDGKWNTTNWSTSTWQ